MVKMPHADDEIAKLVFGIGLQFAYCPVKLILGFAEME